MRYFIELSYNGTNYSGWQIQKNAISIQQVLEEKLTIIFCEKIEIIGCGRTDAGVHAKQYFAHFDTQNNIPEKFIFRINCMLPKDIALHQIFEVDTNKNARFDAEKRTYKYFIHYQKDVFKDAFSFMINDYNPDINLMNNATKILLGEKDFSAFEKLGSDNQHSICTVFEANFEAIENGLIFTISANRFLRNMVRSITGSLLMVGLKRITTEELEQNIKSKKQINISLAPPAKGLFLWKINYKKDLYLLKTGV